MLMKLHIRPAWSALPALALLLLAQNSTVVLAGNPNPDPLPTDWSTAFDAKTVSTLWSDTADRDSCTSTSLWDRVLWLCRDTGNKDGVNPGFFYSNSAGWTKSAGNPDIGSNGLSTYPDPPTELLKSPPNDTLGGRFVMWPNTRPYVNYAADGQSATIYSWIEKAKIDGLTALIDRPSTLLFKATVTKNDIESSDNLPSMTQTGNDFWPTGSITYGSYGTVENGDYLYLYGQLRSDPAFEKANPMAPKNVSLAVVHRADIEDPSKYWFFVNGAFTKNKPQIDDQSVGIENAGTGGQGTFFWSYKFNKFIWIGQNGVCCTSDFGITTAQDPWGPWAKPSKLYSGQDSAPGAGLPPYSMQAHPGLSVNEGRDSNIWLTYTRKATDKLYDNPLIELQWK